MNSIVKSELHEAEVSILSELRSLGYFKIKPLHYKSHDIFFEADGKLRDILVRARICDQDNGEFHFSTSEKRLLKKRAHKGHREAWVALLEFDAEKKTIGRIIWDIV